MPSNIPYILMQDRLSTGGSFLLCDSNARGFPIRYASQGFADLFGYYASECLGRKCGDLVAPKTMLDGPALHCLTQLCDLTGAEVQEGVQTLNEYIVEECQQMMAARGSKVGFAVVVNQKKGRNSICVRSCDDSVSTSRFRLELHGWISKRCHQ